MEELNLIGKEQSAQSVYASIKAGRLSHAVMITGDKGIGKSVFADYVCKMLLCECEEKPCGSCIPCSKIQKGIHPDIFKIYPAGKSETIGVHEIEIVKRNLYVKPNDANCKVFIIYNADRMNRFAQNAMLKMIEEPPEDSYFVFTCQNSQSLLPTVRSRLIGIALSPAPIEAVKAELKKRLPELSEPALVRAAERSCGNIGVALELAEDGELSRIYDDIDRIAKAVCDRDRAILCLELGKYSKKKENALRLVELLKLTFRDVCAVSAGSSELLSGCAAAAERLGAVCGGKAALEAMDACDSFLSAVRGNANLALSLAAFEIALGDAIRR